MRTITVLVGILSGHSLVEASAGAQQHRRHGHMWHGISRRLYLPLVYRSVAVCEEQPGSREGLG